MRKGRGYSHGLQGLAEPRFQRLEVFYDHFNHHPERPGPPASPPAAPAATAAAAAPAAGSAPPRRPAARLPPRLPAASAAPRFGRGRRAGAGGPAIRRGRNQSSSGCFPRALLSPLLYGGRRPKRCAGPPRRRAARPSVAAVRSGTGGPPAALSRSARRSERPNERVRWRRPAVARAKSLARTGGARGLPGGGAARVGRGAGAGGACRAAREPFGERSCAGAVAGWSGALGAEEIPLCIPTGV